MKSFAQTLVVLALAGGLGLSLGKLAQAAGPHATEQVTIHQAG